DFSLCPLVIHEQRVAIHLQSRSSVDPMWENRPLLIPSFVANAPLLANGQELRVIQSISFMNTVAAGLFSFIRRESAGAVNSQPQLKSSVSCVRNEASAAPIFASSSSI